MSEAIPMNSDQIIGALSGRSAAEERLRNLCDQIVEAEKAAITGMSPSVLLEFIAAAKTIKDDAYSQSDDEWGEEGRYRYADYARDTEIEHDHKGFTFKRSGPEHCKGCYMGDPIHQRTIPFAVVNGEITVVTYVTERVTLIRAQIAVDRKAKADKAAAALEAATAAEIKKLAQLKAKYPDHKL